MRKYLKILLSFFAFCLSALFRSPVLLLCGITFAFIMPLNPPAGNWYQQFMPNLGNQQINDITFIDSLTGFAIASKNVNPDTSRILKTTNGGDNWQIVLTQGSRRFSRIIFINSLTGFISGGSGTGTPYLYKSTDGGNNWSIITGATFGTSFWNDMSVINENIIWLVDANGLNGGVFFTSNGGTNWIQQFSGGSQNPNKIYMVNSRTGFMSKNGGSPNIYKTSNSGQNWFINVNGHYIRDMKFADTLTGWYSYLTNVYKTTSGGNNWIIQQLPTGGNIITTGVNEFSSLNKDTVWGVGGEIIVGTQTRGIIYRSVNGGQNWTFQMPDTAIYVPGPYQYLQFVNSRQGWAYTLGFYGGIHTTYGGDPVWLTGITQISSEIPLEFKLYQNYPNPFNPKTNIKYSVMSNVKSKKAKITLLVYDITGREVAVLVNEEQNAGTYEVDFSGSGYSSGVYFYKLTVSSASGGGKEVYSETKKMILIK